MIELNALTEYGADGLSDSGDEEAVEDVAYAFLTANGLVKPPAIRVGSKEFTEQLIPGKLFVLLLRDAGYEVEDLTGYGGTTPICQAVEAGEIDIYPEYNGTATSVHHNIPVTALPTTAERAYALARSLMPRLASFGSMQCRLTIPIP
ncbi:MAG: glycine betaine ABC transporter substrate-binding protein [Caldilineaceae bacterium]